MSKATMILANPLEPLDIIAAHHHEVEVLMDGVRDLLQGLGRLSGRDDLGIQSMARTEIWSSVDRALTYLSIAQGILLQADRQTKREYALIETVMTERLAA